jgi:hypothetical protein
MQVVKHQITDPRRVDMMATAARILYSRQTSKEVIAALIALALDPVAFYRLELVSYQDSDEIACEPLEVKLDPAGARTTLADESEIAHCITQDGRKASLLLGRPAEQDLQPAQVLIGD